MDIRGVTSQRTVDTTAVLPRPVPPSRAVPIDRSAIGPAASGRQPLKAIHPGLANQLNPAPAAFLQAHKATPRDMPEAIAYMQALEADLVRQQDGRAVFVSTYLQILKATDDAVRQPGYFEDPATVEAEGLRFVQYYIDNHEAYERGDMASVAKPWKSAFDRAASGKALAFENLILGINAHVNYDLPRALAVVNAHTPAQQRDFQKFNDLLFERIDAIQSEVVQRYTTPRGKRREHLLVTADKALGSLDETATKALFTVWRNRAWKRRGELLEGQVTALDRMGKSSHHSVVAVSAIRLINPLHDTLVKRRLA
jgi:hypothetical protein